MPHAVKTQHLPHRQLMEDAVPGLWDRLVKRLMTKDADFQKDFGLYAQDLQQRWAERIIDASIAYLRVHREYPGRCFSPSDMVDIGVHVTLLYTREYRALSRAVAGRVVEHNPTDVPGVDYSESPRMTQTVAAMKDAGMFVDESLWQEPSASDSQGCGSSGF